MRGYHAAWEWGNPFPVEHQSAFRARNGSAPQFVHSDAFPWNELGSPSLPLAASLVGKFPATYRGTLVGTEGPTSGSVTVYSLWLTLA